MCVCPLPKQVAQQGLTWGALGQSITPDFPFSGRGVFLMVTADIFIYALLTAYLDHVRLLHLLIACLRQLYLLHRCGCLPMCDIPSPLTRTWASGGIQTQRTLPQHRTDITTLLVMPATGGALRGGAAAAAPVLLPAAVLLACPPRAHHRREAAGTLAVQVLALQHRKTFFGNYA